MLKAQVPEHILAHFSVPSMVRGWDPAWLEDLLSKTEEILRTPDHPLIKAHGPFESLSTLNTGQLDMLMQMVAIDLTIEKLQQGKGEAAPTGGGGGGKRASSLAIGEGGSCYYY